jgi:hypothetical protein
MDGGSGKAQTKKDASSMTMLSFYFANLCLQFELCLQCELDFHFSSLPRRTVNPFGNLVAVPGYPATNLSTISIRFSLLLPRLTKLQEQLR